MSISFANGHAIHAYIRTYKHISRLTNRLGKSAKHCPDGISRIWTTAQLIKQQPHVCVYLFTKYICGTKYTTKYCTQNIHSLFFMSFTETVPPPPTHTLCATHLPCLTRQCHHTHNHTVSPNIPPRHVTCTPLHSDTQWPLSHKETNWCPPPVSYTCWLVWKRP